MNLPKITSVVLAVAGIAILCSGCGSTDYRAQWAQRRCEQVMAQARMDAVQELLAAGQIDHAQKVLIQYLPEAAQQRIPLLMIASEDEGKEESPSQYARITLEKDLDPQAQAW